MRTLLFVLPLLVACGEGKIVYETGDATPVDTIPADSTPVDTEPEPPLPPDTMPPVSEKPVIVAVGFGSKRARSLDGITWTDFAELMHDAPEDENLFRGVGFGNGLFVAVGGSNDGLISTSPDGKTWSAPDHSPSDWLAGSVYFKNRYVIAGGNGLRMWSDDAVTWTRGGEHQTVHYRDLAANDAIAVAVGHTTVAPTVGIIATSSDGKIWVERRRGGQQHNRVVFGNGVFVTGGHAGKVEISPDGIAWTEHAVVGATGSIEHLVFTGTEFIISSAGSHFRSTTGATWTSQPAVRAINGVFGDRFLSFTKPAAIHSTTDLATWSTVFDPAGTPFVRMTVGVLP